MADPWSAMDWRWAVRHIPNADGRYDRDTLSYGDGNTTSTPITGHKTVLARQESQRWRFEPSVGDILNGDCLFTTTTEMNRSDLVEFNENEAGTIVARYRVEAIAHRHVMMTKYVTGLTTRITYLLREVQRRGQ